MKRILTILLSLVMVVSVSSTVFAAELNDTAETDDAIITANVPDTHKIAIETDGNGNVYLDGTSVKIITADRLSTPKVLICPESGYTIDKVMLGEQDITSKINGGYYTFDAVYKDDTLKATFKKAENGSFQYSVVGSVTKNNAPAADISLELRSDLKTFVTGKDGKFGFKNVEEGHHTLTAIDNDKIVGYAEFYLTRTDNVVNMEVKENTDGSFNVQVNKSFTILELNFNIADDGKLEITSSNATNKPEDVKDYPNAPQTGDNSNMLVWIILLIISVNFVVFLTNAKHKNRRIMK